MRENEVYVTERGVYIGIESISGNSAWIKVLSKRDGKVIQQSKEVILVDREVPVISDVISNIRTVLAKATPDQVAEFHSLLNVKNAVREDKATTTRKDTLTNKDQIRLRRV